LTAWQTLSAAALVAASLWGLTTLQQALSRTTSEFAALQAVYAAAHRLATARLLAQTPPSSLDAARAQLSRAQGELALSPSLERSLRAASSEGLLAALREAVAQAQQASTAASLTARASAGLARAQQLIQALRQHTAARNDRARAAAARLAQGVALGAILVAGIVAALGLQLRRCVTGPLAALTRCVDRLAAGEFTLPAASCDARDAEFAALLDRFRDMARRLGEAQAQLEARVEARTAQFIRSERLARLGVVAAGFAHEINNPLAIMRGHAELALRSLDRSRPEASDEAAAALRLVVEEVDRARSVIAQLQALQPEPRSGQASPPATPLHEPVDAAVRLAAPLASEKSCTIVRRCRCPDACVRVPLERGEATQLLINLLLNALHASSHSDEITVECRCDERTAHLVVRDRGAGMTPEQLACVFDPFYSTRNSAGLGLTVCQAIVERSGGWIDAHSDGPGRGSVFTVVLPCAEAREQAA